MADNRDISYFYLGTEVVFLGNFTSFRSVLAEVLHGRGNFWRHALSLLEETLVKELCKSLKFVLSVRGRYIFFIYLMESAWDRDIEIEIKIGYGCFSTAI